LMFYLAFVVLGGNSRLARSGLPGKDEQFCRFSIRSSKR
jgi:hypothetical protein